MEVRKSTLKLALGAGCALAVLASASAASAEQRTFSLASSRATDTIPEFARQAGIQIVAPADRLRNVKTPAIEGRYDTREALAMLVEGTGLRVASDDGRTVTLVAADPQGGSAAGGGAEVEALIVTAQKREEDIQDVPIAISAFSQEDLTRSQIAGGPDLITQVPNMTFTKTNFSSYSVQLRGIGTQAISATTDPAVAIAFNNTPFIRNRFFEQEFYDLQRVEVLRGPQGTLYGRNATAGVVNIISQKPKFVAEAKLSGDVSNYNSSRLEGMVNIPLVEDKVALRLAGAWTKRDGYATNEISGEPIDGRDLWSTRVSLRFSPTDRFDANLIWEHFEEDDDRLRSGKQLCDKHVVSQLGDLPVDFYAAVPDRGQAANVVSNVQSVFSQGCERNSLYSPESFQTPNGLSLPYYLPLGAGLGLPTVRSGDGGASNPVRDPYLSTVQSRDLRVIESTVDPDYRAKADLAELQVSFDLTDTLTLQSETAYSVDFVWSKQDFNRFNTAPGTWATTGGGTEELLARGILSADGFFCDPQLGCADRLVAVDVSTAEARQFSQELRLSSDYDGPFNFSLGANFLRADSKDKYYVFINSISMVALRLLGAGQPYVPGETDNLLRLSNGPVPGDPNAVYDVGGWGYIDPNPIGSLNDQGHNYFLSNNPYKLISYAVFGEAYYNITDALKVTAGLRWTVDKKEAPRVPSWILVPGYGYPVAEVIEQEWREPTGRLTIDWKPDLAFTDETMVYASYAHGYKAGGANPPGFVRTFFGGLGQGSALAEVAAQSSATRPKTFDAEFVDAFEIGSKNTLLDGSLTMNLAAFYYDYKDYQISEIVDRSAFNRNFDATVWGIELESDWRPLENLKLGLKIGYEETAIADGERAVDLMDRTAGMPGWSVIRPFPTYASNCILPTALYLPPLGTNSGAPIWGLGSPNGGGAGGCEYAYISGFDPGTEAPFGDPCGSWSGSGSCAAGFWRDDPITGESLYPGFDPFQEGINFGEGFYKDLGGNELPNAPNLTATITGDYTIPLPNDWLATLHTDLHWQAESDWRIFQDHEYSKLDEYFTMNLAAIFTNEELGWNIMAYIKNVTDETAITGAFLNSDDTGLTTNVFLTEPRLYGLRVTKLWTGGAWFDGFSARSKGPYPFTVELGGQVQRHDAPYETLLAGFEDDFPEELNNFAGAQNRDLDWGDGRDVKLTWRPAGGSWSVSAGVRYGKTNSDTTRDHTLINTGDVCGLPAFNPYRDAVCTPGSPYFDKYNSVESVEIWSAAHVRNDEDHQLIDFAVGKDIGIGGLTRSTLSAGIRFGQFESQTTAYAGGVPDRYLKEGWVLGQVAGVEKYMSLYNRYQFDLQSKREFEGAGPVLSWDAALALLGSDDTGRLQLDWSVTGGVLFGEQQTSGQGSGQVTEFRLRSPTQGSDLLGADDLPPVVIVPRSEDVTVPVAGASIGLSYEIDRVRIGAGYRWERYFDVLDGGFEAKKDADRTIDGPYFKIAVGFGGG